MKSPTSPPSTNPPAEPHRTYRVHGGGTIELSNRELESDWAQYDDGTITRLSATAKRDCADRRDKIFRGLVLANHRRTSTSGQHCRARRTTGARRRGSRRSSSSSRTSSADPGDSDGDSDPPGVATPPAGGEIAERMCLAIDCEKSIAHKAPQARFCSNACRVRDKRAQEARDLLAIEQSVASRDRLPVDPDDVDPIVREVFDEETAGRWVRDGKRKHTSFQMAVAA